MFNIVKYKLEGTNCLCTDGGGGGGGGGIGTGAA